MPPSIVTLSPSGDTTGVTDTAAVNGALAGAPGTSVHLNPGEWYASAPWVIPSGNELSGTKGGVNGTTTDPVRGTAIHPGSAFSGGAVILMQDGTKGQRVRDLGIGTRTDSFPAAVNGIQCAGNVEGVALSRLSIAWVTGHGVAFTQLNGVDGDGLKMHEVMIQHPGLNGVHRPTNDANIHDVHVQYAGEVDGAGSAFFTTPESGGNMSYVGCRADLSAGYGWVIDHKGTFGDATKLTGCSTERNQRSGVLVTNSSSGGSDWRAPVVIAGCCFEGDGWRGGDYGGVQVDGRNRVFISGTVTAVSTTDLATGAPKFALTMHPLSGTNPETVEWASGRLNYSTGQSGAAIWGHSYPDVLNIGPTVTQTGGFENEGPRVRFNGATLSGGTKTVSNPWVFGTSTVLITPAGNPAGRLYVSAVTEGSFTVKSTSSADNTPFSWLIL